MSYLSSNHSFYSYIVTTKNTILVLFLFFNFQYSFSTVVTYPKPPGFDSIPLPHLKESSDYTVTVNGQSSFVYESDNYWDGGGNPQLRRMETKAAFTNFDFKGEIVTVKVGCKFKVNSVTIRPKSDMISFTQKGDTVIFSFRKSKYLSVEINDRLKPLFIFADSIETPPAAAANVTIYGPGIHYVGTKCALPRAQTVYIAGGAVVIGTFTSNGNNLKIKGRGILNSGGVTWDEWMLDKSLSPLATAGGSMDYYQVGGITMLNAPGWHVNAYGDKTKFVNLKCIAWCGNSDGPHLNGNGVMTHCFIFNNDDALITNKGDNNTFTDCVVWGGYWGHPLISLTDNSQNHVTWQDIDVIGAQAYLTFRVGKIISIETAMDNAPVPATAVKQNFLFKNIRIEGQLPDRNGLIYMCAQDSAVIKNITFENITTELLRTNAGDTEGAFDIKHATAKIDSIAFKGLRMNNELISSLAQAHFKASGPGTNALNMTRVIFDNTGYLQTEVETVNEMPKIQFYTSNGKLKFNAGDININTVNIYNSAGAKVKSGKIDNIDIENLPVGVYHIKAEADGINYVGKFLKK